MNNINDKTEIKSKTMEQLEKKNSFGVDTSKYATFQQELADTKEDNKDEGNKIENERYNDPAEDPKEKKKTLLQMMMDSFKKEDSKKKGENVERIDNSLPSTTFDGMTVKDIVAPIDMEIDFKTVQMGDFFYRTFFISGYPRFVGPNWLSPLVNFEHSLRISTFYYPVDSKVILEKLKKKIGEIEATLYTQMEERKVVDPSLKVKLTDAQQLQDSIAEGTEKFFHFGMYITIYARTGELLDKYSKNLVSTLAAINVTAKPATLLQEQGLISTEPLGLDKIYITRNMDTTSLATTFPFVTSELTMDHGIMYGINQHNNSLVIFDRFELENANMVVFAKSGAGKSYAVKLESVRSLMLGTEVIIIDPEREYEDLSKAVDGAYISFSQDQGNKMNPFELSGVTDQDEDELRMKMLTLQGFFKVLFEGLNNVESSILDRALILTYREKGITFDPATQKNRPPLLEDLYKVLKGMAEPEAHDMARRLEKYIIGSGAGIFNQASNFEIDNPFTVFSIRDLQDELKPLAMYLMLDFIWTKIRKDQKRRLLVVDEAWYMMQSEDSAKFMYSIAKRARKYYLGLTTITQDVADFMTNEMGKAIISNSSIQLLMKQSPSSVDTIQERFNLSEGEKSYLLNCDKGQGLFFAGSNHVAIQVVSSQAENELITSDPRDLEKKRQTAGKEDTRSIEELAGLFEAPITQKIIQSQADNKRQSEMLTKAVEQRKEDIGQIQKERSAYEIELEKKLNEEKEKQLQQGVLKDLEDNSLTAQVVKDRKELQKDSLHITPQGYINEGEGNGQQPNQQQ
jgi:conjugal transfer ATP-binding protein TraC